MKKILLLTMLGLGVLSIQAQDNQPLRDTKKSKAQYQRRQHPGKQMDSVLQLTEAQKLKLEALNKEYQDKRMAVYTPEQRERLEQYKQSRKAAFKQGRKTHYQQGARSIQPPLTEAQKTSMKSLREQHRNELAVVKANQQLDTAAKQQKIKSLQEAHRQSIREILTPEQLEQLKKRQKPTTMDGPAR